MESIVYNVSPIRLGSFYNLEKVKWAGTFYKLAVKHLIFFIVSLSIIICNLDRTALYT